MNKEVKPCMICNMTYDGTNLDIHGFIVCLSCRSKIKFPTLKGIKMEISSFKQDGKYFKELRSFRHSLEVELKELKTKYLCERAKHLERIRIIEENDLENSNPILFT